MVSQIEFTLHPHIRGFHLITEKIISRLPVLPRSGLLHLFMKHTSAALTINENADPDVQTDMCNIFDHPGRARKPITHIHRKVLIMLRMLIRLLQT